jgi:GTP-binding protein HflX
MRETVGQLKILFVYLAHPRSGKSEIDEEITELWNLVQSMGDAQVMDLVMQKGEEFAATYIGPGKAREVFDYLSVHPIDIVAFNGPLTANQKFNLTKMYWDINPKIEIWDRIDLILAIFSRHAHTREARLQIDLAQMVHMGPRIYGMGMVLSRQGGGIGTRGIGETNTERMKRHWKREIKRVTDELSKAAESRKRQMEKRKDSGLKTISLVGYTNAGKTSLFNVLTHKKNLVENALFATLDSTVGKVYVPELASSIIFSDTIGFIANLPPDLISAFKSTLMESIHADVVLHVIDVSDPNMLIKMDVVSDILDQLNIPEEKIILVFSKIDLVPSIEKEKITETSFPYPHVFVSAKTKIGIEGLLSLLSIKLFNR